jgi:protease PrsW
MLVGLILGVIFVTPLVLTYLFFIRWADRFEPEPWWLIMVAFVWGAIFATMGGGITSSIASSITSGIFQASPKDMDVIGATVFAPVFEEGFKGLGVALIAVERARAS